MEVYRSGLLANGLACYGRNGLALCIYGYRYFETSCSFVGGYVIVRNRETESTLYVFTTNPFPRLYSIPIHQSIIMRLEHGFVRGLYTVRSSRSCLACIVLSFTATAFEVVKRLSLNKHVPLPNECRVVDLES